MGSIVAIAGGDLKSNAPINQYIVNLVEKETRHFLFLGTASNDAEGYIANIETTFELLSCEVKALCLVAQTYTEKEIDELLAWADIIYVGGGDTFSMMEIWRKYGLDKKLQEVYKQDSAVLCGISAGAMCWFNCGHSDSEIFWKNGEVRYGWVNDLLDLHHLVYCPHYEERTESFDKMLKEKEMPALAMESDTAFVELNGEIFYISINAEAKAYKMRFEKGMLLKEEIKLQII